MNDNCIFEHAITTLTLISCCWIMLRHSIEIAALSLMHSADKRRRQLSYFTAGSVSSKMIIKLTHQEEQRGMLAPYSLSVSLLHACKDKEQSVWPHTTPVQSAYHLLTTNGWLVEFLSVIHHQQIAVACFIHNSHMAL